MISFSVLICTYNRPQLLRRALSSLVEGTIEKPDEIIVVNGGDESSDGLVRAFDGLHGVRVHLIKTVNKNLATSRNVGLRHCRGELIAWTDDDAQVFPDWVTRMKQAHEEHPEVGAVGGTVVGINSEGLIGRIADKVTFASYSRPQFVRFVAGVNVCYKRDAVDRVGPQDESLDRGEDVDYNWRVLQLGYKILFDPEICVYHYHRPTLRAFLNQHYMYGRAYYLVRRKWPEMYCVYPHGLRRPKDLLKAINFVAAPFYEPLQYGARMERFADRLLAFPILFANQLAWRGGMLRQMLSARRGESMSHRYSQMNTDHKLEENSR